MMKKSLAAILALCLALLFVCGAGAEEGLGLCGKLAGYESADPRLTTMAGVAGPVGWNLYRNGQRVCAAGEQEVFAAGTGEIIFELRYPLAGGIDGLTLVPEYEQSGEHPAEAVALGDFPQE